MRAAACNRPGKSEGRIWLISALIGLASFALVFATLLQALVSVSRDAGGGPRRWLPRGALIALALASVVVWPWSTLIERHEDAWFSRTGERTELVREVIQRFSAGEDRILVWGAQSELYVLSQRTPATRYLYQYPLATRGYVDRQSGAE